MTAAPSLADALAPLREAPARAAILLDVDGTLAPIVRRADRAAVPSGTQAWLARLTEIYGLVACVTGRRASDARGMVGLGSVHYVGTHGAELLRAGWTKPRLDPRLAEWPARVTAFVRAAETPVLRTLGVRREDKGPIAAFHWRGARDEEAARAAVQELAARAEAEGFWIHWGRKVLEVRPSVPIDKGEGVRALLAGTPVRAALYAGDDATDLDAFRALADLQAEGSLEHTVRVGVASEEGPPAILAEADVTVDGPGGVVGLLGELAAA